MKKVILWSLLVGFIGHNLMTGCESILIKHNAAIVAAIE